MDTVTDIKHALLTRLRAELERIERWAEYGAKASRSDPDWLFKRRYVTEHDNVTAEEYLLELHQVDGAESAYADLDARIALLRSRLPDEARRLDENELLEALHSQLGWCDAQRTEALAAIGAAIEPEELHALGRAETLAEVQEELRNLISSVPWGTF